MSGSAEVARYSLSGTVVNGATGEPIARALVRLNVGMDWLQLTDTAGHFEFDGLPETKAMLDAQKPGFFSSRQLAQGAFFYKPITIGPNAKPVVLKLVPEGIIIGHVTDANEEPLEGFGVRLTCPRINQGHKRMQPCGGGSTRADGSFRIANLTPGVYYLSVVPGWNAIGSEGEGQGYQITYYPGGSDLASASAITVAAGQTVQADLTLQPQTVFKVAGKVGGLQPGQGPYFRLLSDSGEEVPVRQKFDALTGSFEMQGVPAGSYRITAEGREPGGRQLTASAPLVVAGNLSDVQLLFQPSVEIPVIVRMEGSSPQHTANQQELPYINVHLSAVGREERDLYANPEGEPANRRWVLRDVAPGRYSVEIMALGSWYVAAATAGSTDLLRNDLIVTSASAAQPIELVLRDDCASIQGVVVTSVPESMEEILVLGRRGPAMLRPATNMMGQANRFNLEGLAPGEYTLYAFDSLAGLAYADAGALGDYSSRAVHVELSANENKTISLELIQRGQQ